MLRLCFVTEDFYPEFIGGQGIYGKKLIEGFAKKANVTVLAENKKGRKAFWKNSSIQLFLVPFCFGNQILLAFFEYLLLVFFLRNEKLDVLHANQLSGLFFVLVRPKNIKKIIISVHNTYWDMYRHEKSLVKKCVYNFLMVVEKFVYERADGLIYNSYLEQQALIQKYSIKNIPGQVIQLGANNVHITKKEKLLAQKLLKKQLNMQNKYIILYIGRLVKRKNVDIFLKALRQLQKEKVSVVGLIVGQGKELERLQKIAPSNALFLGYVENVKEYFLTTDIFINLSVGEGGVVLTALEAAHCGLPLILSKESGEYPLLNGENGLMVNNLNPREVANKIKEVLKDKKKMSEKSKKLAKSFTWQETVEKTFAFYQVVQKVSHKN